MTRKPVAVGIDGSAAADVAIKWATLEAASFRTDLRLLYAAPPGGSASHAGDIAYRAVALARGLDPRIAIDSHTENGVPSAVLVKASGKAAIVVIGSRGLGLMAGALLGSTGLDLAANARCPVVVVRPDLGTTAGLRVVVGYDGSPASDTALDFGLDYARRHDLAIRVVAAQPEGTEHLLRLSSDADLIVLGARGRGGFAGMLIGSVSQTVLHHADCPVAIIPAAAIGG